MEGLLRRKMMYLHIGNNYSVDRAEKEHHCIYTTYEMPKSFIIIMKNGREKVYISQLSAATLRKRLKDGGGF